MRDGLRRFLAQLGGKLRRVWLLDWRPAYVAERLRHRTGECRKCGKCCRLLFRCPFLRRDRSCRIYGRMRPGSCSAFPIDERDSGAVGGDCGYSFARKPQHTTAELPEPRSLVHRNMVHDLSLLLALVCASHATSLSLVLGTGVFALGVLTTVWSKLALTRNVQLVTAGPYALCRHPFYLGNALIGAGVCVMSGYIWLLLLYPFIFYVGYRHTIVREEAQLRESFPDSHSQFARSTPLILPLGKRILRDWHTRLRWSNLLKEHLVSRSLRRVAYPVLVVLASRLWAAPAEASDARNLTLVAVAFAAWVGSAAVYWGLERGARSKGGLLVARVFSDHPVATWSLLILVAALAGEWEVEEAIDALLWGVAMLSAEAAIRTYWPHHSASWGRLLAPLGSGVIGIGVLIAFGAGFLVPVGLALLLCRFVLPPTPSRRLPMPSRLMPSLATAAVLLSASAIALEMHSENHARSEMARQVTLIARYDDEVVVLKDDDLAGLKNRTHVDAEVTAVELDLLIARGPKTGRRLFVVADEDDLDELSPTTRLALVSERIVRSGMERFQLLTYRKE